MLLQNATTYRHQIQIRSLIHYMYCRMYRGNRYVERAIDIKWTIGMIHVRMSSRNPPISALTAHSPSRIPHRTNRTFRIIRTATVCATYFISSTSGSGRRTTITSIIFYIMFSRLRKHRYTQTIGLTSFSQFMNI